MNHNNLKVKILFRFTSHSVFPVKTLTFSLQELKLSKMERSELVENVSIRWQWDWTTLCGEEGFQIWSFKRHDFGICFQQLCLHIPVLFLLAISSAYYYGKPEGYVTRGKCQMFALNTRCIIVLILTFLPLLQIYIDINKSDIINEISYFVSAVQGITWFTHFLYILGLRKKLGLSSRGPAFVSFFWSLIFAITIVSTRSHYMLYKYDFSNNFSIYLGFVFSICYMIAQILYALTLIPGEGSATYLNFSARYTQVSLIHSYFVKVISVNIKK